MIDSYIYEYFVGPKDSQSEELPSDYISYNMARQMGQYATDLKYCEVIVNGDYRGLYALSEKIKRDGDRVDISKLSDDENTIPEVTGGYLMQTDRPDADDPEAWNNNGAGYIHEYPKSGKLTIIPITDILNKIQIPFANTAKATARFGPQ